uniref:Neurotransmitter-gated ion-channel transmembrane domain-containing protein n=1 Tax=Oreochromis aureus TaxID=47969 RepID=A0A668VSE9_OREAU
MEEDKAPPAPYGYLHSNSKVDDAQPVKVVSSCNLDIYTFPRDIQNCAYTFNSYMHFGKRFFLLYYWISPRIKKTQNNIDTDGLYVNELRRQATMYMVNLLHPSSFLIAVDLFSFLLPPQTVDRSALEMTFILGYTIFLLIMNDLLPVTGNTIPLINVFFSICLALMVASLLETILITNVLRGSADFSPVPHWMRVLVLQFLGFLVFVKEENHTGKTKPQETMGPAVKDGAVRELKKVGKDLQDIHLQVQQQQKENQGSEEWIQVGFIIDRLLFMNSYRSVRHGVPLP